MEEQSQNPSNRRPLKLRSIEWIKSFARTIESVKISPNQISVFGLISGLFAGGVFLLTSFQSGSVRFLWFFGVFLILLRILANTLDGMVAIECGQSTRAGILYNEAPDRLSDAALLIGVGYSDGGSVEFGYLGACVALFVAYVRILSNNAGAPMDFGGPMAKGHRLITIIVSALFMSIAPVSWQVRWGPDNQWGIMTIALIIIILGGMFTAVRRLCKANNYLMSLD